MGPKGKHPATGDLFQQPLAELINLKHPLVKLAELIDWSVFETRWAAFFPSRTGRPASWCVATSWLPCRKSAKPSTTPPDKSGEWLPWVHVAIGNLKAFLLGTYHGVSSKHLQEYLNEFCYRFNRRAWEPELPLRLLNACLTHTQVKLRIV